MEYSSEMRKKAGLTQSQLAKLVGVTRVYIGQLENGQRNPSNSLDRFLCEICKHGVSSGVSQNANNGDVGNVIGNEHSHVKIDSQELREDPALEARVKALEADVSQLKTTIINILTRMGE